MQKRKNKFVIEIKTRNRGWVRAILLKICKGYLLIKLPSNDIIRKRDYKGVKFGKTKKVVDTTIEHKSSYRFLKTKKKKRKYFSKKSKKGGNKWQEKRKEKREK